MLWVGDKVGIRYSLGVKGLERVFSSLKDSGVPGPPAVLKGSVRSLCIPLGLENNAGQGSAEFMSRVCILI